MLHPKKRITRFWEHLRRRKQKAHVCIAITASHGPAGLDVGLINKYYDLALTGDDLAKYHYASLNKKAKDCIQCGQL